MSPSALPMQSVHQLRGGHTYTSLEALLTDSLGKQESSYHLPGIYCITCGCAIYVSDMNTRSHIKWYRKVLLHYELQGQDVSMDYWKHIRQQHVTNRHKYIDIIYTTDSSVSNIEMCVVRFSISVKTQELHEPLRGFILDYTIFLSDLTVTLHTWAMSPLAMAYLVGISGQTHSLHEHHKRILCTTKWHAHQRVRQFYCIPGEMTELSNRLQNVQ